MSRLTRHPGKTARRLPPVASRPCNGMQPAVWYVLPAMARAKRRASKRREGKQRSAAGHASKPRPAKRAEASRPSGKRGSAQRPPARRPSAKRATMDRPSRPSVGGIAGAPLVDPARRLAENRPVPSSAAGGDVADGPRPSPAESALLALARALTGVMSSESTPRQALTVALDTLAAAFETDAPLPRALAHARSAALADKTRALALAWSREQLRLSLAE